MNRKIFISLVIMMALSIIGITLVQIRWISNAVNIRNENFNNAVFISLNGAADELESHRRIDFFNDFIVRDPFIIADSSEGITGYFSIDSYISQGGSGFRINIENRSSQVSSFNGNNGQIIISGDTSMIVDSGTVDFGTQQGRGTIQIITEGERINKIPGSVIVDKNDFLNWVRKRQNEFQNLSDQMIREIYESEVGMKLDNTQISNTLGQYFPFYGINTPYEFALISNGEIKNVSTEKISRNEFMKSTYQVRLFADDIIKRDVILSVVFPERTNYVLGSIAWMLGGSMLFSLFIFSTFALSIYFIIRQKKVSEMKSDFINNMTHEFKTPIATISLAADTITNPRVIRDENSIKHFIGMIKKENNRMNKQVETILQIASLDKKEIEFKFERTGLNSIIDRAIDTIEIQVQQKEGIVKKDLAALDDILYGDTEHLVNLVHNLLDNAIKYSPEKPLISISTINRDGGIVLTVEDKGIGMSKSVQSKIFERFYRLASGDVHDVKGFGLGLNYVKAIVDAHRGTVTVFSEPGKGSRFEIFLPLEKES